MYEFRKGSVDRKVTVILVRPQNDDKIDAEAKRSEILLRCSEIDILSRITDPTVNIGCFKTHHDYESYPENDQFTP